MSNFMQTRIGIALREILSGMILFIYIAVLEPFFRINEARSSPLLLLFLSSSLLDLTVNILDTSEIFHVNAFKTQRGLLISWSF